MSGSSRSSTSETSGCCGGTLAPSIRSGSCVFAERLRGLARATELRWQNIFEADLSDATVIFWCCTLFQDAKIAEMVSIILRACPKLRYLLLMVKLNPDAHRYRDVAVTDSAVRAPPLPAVPGVQLPSTPTEFTEPTSKVERASGWRLVAKWALPMTWSNAGSKDAVHCYVPMWRLERPPGGEKGVWRRRTEDDVGLQPI